MIRSPIDAAVTIQRVKRDKRRESGIIAEGIGRPHAQSGIQRPDPR